MSSFFINAGLLTGMTLAAVPLILHLFMKQTPKRVIFPALRLIKERHKRSRKTLKVKNWLLLLFRMALVALMALALARPRLYSKTPMGDREVPTAMALVFDTSLSMGYQERTKDRLTEAKERAADLLKKTPDASQVFVVDSAEPGVPVPMSPAAARKRVDALAIRAANRPLNAAMGQAYSAVAASDRPRHEVYVLTDLAASAWNLTAKAEGLEKAAKVDGGVATYILRLNPKDARDVAVVAAEPSSAVAVQGEPVEIRAAIRSTGGKPVKRIVELLIDGTAREKASIELAPGGEVERRFLAPRLEPGLHRGEVRVSGEPDPMSFDDVRYFSFEVEPALKVLVISDTKLDSDFVSSALDPEPDSPSPGQPRLYQVEVDRPRGFSARSDEALRRYTCIFWLNVAQPSGDDWGKLRRYVGQGGGLTIALGNRVDRGSYSTDLAAGLMPVELAAKLPAAKDAKETTFGAPADATHPLFNRYTKELSADLAQVPIFRHWPATVREGSRVLLPFADGAPALVERTFKGPSNGHVLLWTTPLARDPNRNSDAAWNEFPQTTEGGWTFLVLMRQTVPYLAGSSTQKLNYEAGEDVVIPIDPTRRLSNYIVQGPDAKASDRQNPNVGTQALVVVAPQPVGQWTVTATGPDNARETMGFSVNPPLAEAAITPLVPAQLENLFDGKDKYQLADDPEALQKVVKTGRNGFEIFPWIMALILMLVTAESFLANRFYRQNPGRVAALA